MQTYLFGQGLLAVIGLALFITYGSDYFPLDPVGQAAPADDVQHPGDPEWSLFSKSES
jgi:hypothetical protein